MAVKSRDVLKTYFETGDYPTQEQFWDWLDSFVHKYEDAGSVVHFGATIPAIELGRNGDVYMRTALPYTIYRKVAGLWVPQLNAANINVKINGQTYNTINGVVDLGNGYLTELPAHTHPLSDLTQSGATNGQVPSWNGSAWVPTTISTANIYNSNGTLTDNRQLTLGGNSLSVLSGSNTAFHLFPNGRAWFGVGTPVDAGYQVDFQGLTRFSNDVLINTNAFIQGQVRLSGGGGDNTNIVLNATSHTVSFVGGFAAANVIIGSNQFRTGVIASGDNILIGRSPAMLLSGTSNNYTTANCNIVIGRQAAPELVNGVGNLIIGSYAAQTRANSGNFPIGNSSHKFLIGNGFTQFSGYTSYTLLYGDFSTGQLIVNPINGVDNPNINPSVQFGINSTTRGFLPPRMTGAQAEAIPSPAEGLMVYVNNGNGTVITSTGWWGYNGTTWVKLN